MAPADKGYADTYLLIHWDTGVGIGTRRRKLACTSIHPKGGSTSDSVGRFYRQECCVVRNGCYDLCPTTHPGCTCRWTGRDSTDSTAHGSGHSSVTRAPFLLLVQQAHSDPRAPSFL